MKGTLFCLKLKTKPKKKKKKMKKTKKRNKQTNKHTPPSPYTHPHKHTLSIQYKQPIQLVSYSTNTLLRGKFHGKFHDRGYSDTE